MLYVAADVSSDEGKLKIGYFNSKMRQTKIYRQSASLVRIKIRMSNTDGIEVAKEKLLSINFDSKNKKLDSKAFVAVSVSKQFSCKLLKT